MTFQTSPYMQWTFPDEAYEIAKSRKGVQYSNFSSNKDLGAEVGSESPWAQHEYQVAMDRVRNTQRAKTGMEGHLNTTERSQRYDRPASRSAVPNGIFEGSPMEYLTSAGLRGGRIYTKEGQEWLARRLQERIGEYEAIATGNFSRGMPAPIAVSPYTNVDTLLSQIFAAFSAGSFTSSVAQALNQLLDSFLKIGAALTPSQLGVYAKSVQQLNETIRGYRGGEPGIDYERGNIEEQLMGEEARAPIYNPGEERLRLVQSMQTTLKLINGVIREIARTINDPLSGRQQVMATLSQRLLGEQLAEFNPEFAGEERQAAVRNVPGVPQGVPSGRTLLGPTFAEERQAQQDEQDLLQAGFPQFEEQQPNPNQDLEDLAGRMEGQGKKQRGRPRKYKY